MKRGSTCTQAGRLVDLMVRKWGNYCLTTAAPSAKCKVRSPGESEGDEVSNVKDRGDVQQLGESEAMSHS